MPQLHPPDTHTKHLGEQYYAELELRILIKKIRHESLEVQTAELSKFVIRSRFHREAARLYLKNLERHREAISRIGSWGFAEGAHVPGSHIRKVDHNRRHK